jgi:hypothetical protein
MIARRAGVTLVLATVLAGVWGSPARTEEAKLVRAKLPDGTRVTRTDLSVDGTEFVVRNDGRTLRSRDLVGAVLTMRIEGREVAVTIDRVSVDDDVDGGSVVLHRFLVDDGGRPADLCTADADGRNLGFPIPDGRGSFELACTSGAVGKCVRWGYRPWLQRRGGPPHRALHAACTRMVRADYGGDGKTYTRDGTLVYVCDRHGVRPCADDAPMAFEAGWGTGGATCVARTRLPDVIGLAELGERYPALDLGPRCTLEAATDDPETLVVNRSAVATTRGRTLAYGAVAVAVVVLGTVALRRRRRPGVPPTTSPH